MTKKYYALFIIFILNSITPAMSAGLNNDLLKVAYIYNIANFTRWPDSTWDKLSDAFILCSYGTDIISSGLDKLESKLINKRPTLVINVKEDQDLKDCNALYINTDQRRSYRYLLSKINQQNVLVIANNTPFFDFGSLINLIEKDKRLRFQVSKKQLSKSQLNLSSKLLKLAILVDDVR